MDFSFYPFGSFYQNPWGSAWSPYTTATFNPLFNSQYGNSNRGYGYLGTGLESSYRDYSSFSPLANNYMYGGYGGYGGFGGYYGGNYYGGNQMWGGGGKGYYSYAYGGFGSGWW